MQQEKSVERALDEGNLDEALRQLSTNLRTYDDAKLLAFLLSRRGRYEAAVRLLGDDARRNELDATGLRLRGNAAWRAGDLREASNDLQAAISTEADPTIAQSVTSDYTQLQTDIDSLRRIDERLRRVDALVIGAVALVVILLALVNRSSWRALRRRKDR